MALNERLSAFPTMNEEALYALVLSMMPRLNPVQRCELLTDCGSAKAACEHPSVKQRVEPLLERAEKELEWASRHNIQCIPINDERYPRRMRLCPDAPVALFLLGRVNLNPEHVLAVVGTRKITEYGRRLCEEFIDELAQKSPGTLIVSGLAYGVDVHAHRQSLRCGLPTVGVLAHGLDQIYPTAHRQTAAEMIEKGGGLLTEFPSGTHVERAYFLQRNRIVAGMADATIIIQGACRSGSLVTADITDSYGRELFACPGRVGDEMSEGCNRLIQTQKAHMMLSVDDLLREMNWPDELLRMQTMQDGVQQTLFPDMTPEERTIVEALRDADGCTVNEIAQKTGLPIGSLSGLLFSMELKGVLRQGAGGRYTL